MANSTLTGAGNLNSKVIFSERITQADGSGNRQGQWQERFSCAVQIIPAELGCPAKDRPR